MSSLNEFKLGTEYLKLQAGTVARITKCSVQFCRWHGKPLTETYGGKAVIDFEGEPVFAELAILRLLQHDGWDGVWVDNYRRKFRIGLPEKTEPIALPSKAQVLIDKITSVNQSRSGCWDVFAWQGTRVLFVEAKRARQDSMRANQYRWLESAMKSGVSQRSFLIVEWKLEE